MTPDVAEQKLRLLPVLVAEDVQYRCGPALTEEITEEMTDDAHG